MKNKEENEAEEIVFTVKGKERIRITPDSFFVAGKKVADDKVVYDAFVKWLEDTNKIPPKTPILDGAPGETL